MHKKNTQLSETNEDLLRKQIQLEREVISFRAQVMDLKQKPSEVLVPLSAKSAVEHDPKGQPFTNTEEEHAEELIVISP